MPLISISHVKASIFLTRADHLCIYNYIRLLLNIILRPILMVRSRPELTSYCLCVCSIIATKTVIYIYIHQ